MTNERIGYISGLDGLRAIAAMIVVLYHLVPGIAEAGYVGVDMFFVISGFLITALLVKEKEARGKISVRSFWVRRIRRLVPAVAVATLGSLALARIFGGDALTQLRWQAIGSLTGTYNWLQISHASSYFDKQSPLLLSNMWSLAVEQQFYIVWPPIVILLLAVCTVVKIRIVCALLLGIGSIVLHALTVGADPTSAYVSTFSHSFGLMFGAALALALPGLLTGSRAGTKAIWGWISWLSLLAIVALSFILTDSHYMYPWGMVAFSILMVGTIRGLLPDASGFGTRSLRAVLEAPPLVWIGHRSYGIYLWHWPLHVIGFYHSPMAAVPTALIVLMLSIALADISYRYIETPIRTHGFLGWLRTMPPLHKKKAAGIVLAALVTGTAVAGFITEHATSSGQQLIIDAEKQAKEQQSTPAPPPPSEPRDTPENPKRPVLPDVVGENVTVIGDSVTVAATPALQEKLPGIVVNSEVSRSIKQFPTIAAQMAQENQLRPYVVIALGTNGAITEEDAQAILNAVGPDRRIVLVTASAPEYATWVPVSNSTMREMARKNPDRVVIADWQSIALAHPDLLAGDQIHPGTEGSALFAEEIFQALHRFQK